MRILNLLSTGNIGGIESLCRDIGTYSEVENGFCFLFDDGVIYEQMKERGLSTYSIKDSHGKVSIYKLQKLIKIASDYDIIVVHHGDPILKFYFYMLKKKYRHKKFITVVHSCFEEKYFFPNKKIKKIIAKIIFQQTTLCSDKIIFVSEAGRTFYKNTFKIPTGKDCIVYNGIGLDKLNKGRKSEIVNPRKYNITYIGRLDKVKGIDLLLSATKILCQKYPIDVSIIGDGKIRNELKNQTINLGLESIVTFYGKKTDVTPFLEKCDVFVYPSIWQEVFGISVVEAMAYGKLCIANNVGGLPEIIKDGVNGFLTDETSITGIVNAIERAINCYQNGSFVEISESAKKTAEKFSIQNTVDNLNNIYKEVMSNDD